MPLALRVPSLLSDVAWLLRGTLRALPLPGHQ